MLMLQSRLLTCIVFSHLGTPFAIELSRKSMVKTSSEILSLFLPDVDQVSKQSKVEDKKYIRTPPILQQDGAWDDPAMSMNLLESSNSRVSASHKKTSRAHAREAQITECFPQSVASQGWPNSESDFLDIFNSDSDVAALSQFIADRSGCIMRKKTALSLSLSPGLQVPDACRKCWQTFDGSFEHVNGFRPGSHCECTDEASHLTSQQLSGKTIAFVGDSLARQIFLHMIAFLRGEEQVLDHYFHSNATYMFTSAGDCLHIHGLKGDTPCEFTEGGGEGTGKLEFVWAGTEQRGRKTPTIDELVQESRVDAIIAMSGFHFSSEISDGNVASFYTSQKTKDIPVYFMSTPSWEDKTFNQFNSATREIASSHAGWHTIDYAHLATLADVESLRNRRDHTHFQCGVEPAILDTAIGDPLKLKALRGRDSGFFDCRDPVNLALVQAIMINIS